VFEPQMSARLDARRPPQPPPRRVQRCRRPIATVPNALVARVLTRIADGELRPLAPTRLPLDAAAHALTLFERRDVVGKIALTP